ncbi:probable 6-phosphogluconolactonase 1 [Neltuma alba]|uniref:probable 6-phosphogluconolactonase 1 n=1 Tax=Neltuma alba TaxID=207710 RepID=UPI0010A587D6|nr:probable 6-phosphogluconolactonase 1 [Prosopis alba]
MALSTVLLASSSSCVSMNRPFCVQRSHSVSQTTSSLMLQPQAAPKSQHQTLKSKRRFSGTVKALLQTEDKSYTKNVEVFSQEHLLDSLAHDIVQLSHKHIQEKGSFSVALADTSSVRFLRRLVKPAYINTIDWSKWQFFWVEEEVVVPEFQLKRRLLPNELLHKLVYDEFLSMVARTAGTLNVVTIDYDLTATQEAAERYEKNLQNWVARNEMARSRRGLPKFDLMLLGMEEDGRVGSLIPDHPVLGEKERWVTHVKDGNETRLTLTLPVINSSSNIAMVVAGSAKANAVYYSLKDEYDPQAPQRVFPAKLISPEEGDIVWYLDKAAASRIFKEELHIEKRIY